MLVMGTGLLLALIHTPIVRARLLTYVARTLDDSLHIHLEADRFDFNLLTLDFELEQVSLARSDRLDAPFLTAERARVDLPWSAATGTVSFTTIEVDRSMVFLVQSSDATWNLPVITSGDDGPPSEDPFSFPAIKHLVLVDVGIDVRTPGYEVQATEINLEMTVAPSDTRRVTGPLRMSQPARITWGERQTAIEELDARLAFDEDSLEIDSLVARLPEGRFSIDGWVRWVSGGPALDLAYDGTIALASAAHWWRADRADNNVAGEAIVTGTVTGSVREPLVSSHIEAGSVRWGNVSGLDLRGGMSWLTPVESASNRRAQDTVVEPLMRLGA